MRITAAAIERLEPRPTRYERSDPAVPGLQIRVEPTGAKFWQLRYYWKGKRQKLALGVWPRGREPGMSLEQARTAAIKARSLLEAGIDPRRAERTKRAGVVGARLLPNHRGSEAASVEIPAAPRKPEWIAASLTAPALLAALRDRHSVASLACEYVERHVRRQRKRPEYVERFLAAEVLPKWGTRDARTVTPREVVELLDGIVERGAPTMANRGAGILGQMFRYGVHRALVESSPVQLLYRPGGKERPRERVLGDDEIGALLANLGAVMRFKTAEAGRTPRMAHVLRLLLLTGQRRGELALARWSDVSLAGDRPTWQIPAEHSKSGAAHTVPLSPAAVREFEALRGYAGASLYVLPTDDGRAAADPRIITRALARNLARLQALAAETDPPVTLGDFTVHDLRRTCRTGLAKLGISAEIGERILNHAMPAMRAVYDTHEPIEEMREALEKWAVHLEGLASRAQILDAGIAGAAAAITPRGARR